MAVKTSLHFQRCQFRLLAGLQAALLQLGAHAAIQKDKAAAVENFLNLHRYSPKTSYLAKQVVPCLRKLQVSRRWQVVQPARVPVTG